MRAVIGLTSFSKATIYRKMDDGTFPRALKIGKSRVAWRESEIAAWIAGLAK
jgi:prophage regulatory protein